MKNLCFCCYRYSNAFASKLAAKVFPSKAESNDFFGKAGQLPHSGLSILLGGTQAMDMTFRQYENHSHKIYRLNLFDQNLKGPVPMYSNNNLLRVPLRFQLEPSHLCTSYFV